MDLTSIERVIARVGEEVARVEEEAARFRPMVERDSTGDEFEALIARVRSTSPTRKRRRVDSPYYTKEEAAIYCHTTVNGIYGRVERGQLRKCPGSKQLLFTKEMLDESVMVARKPQSSTSGKRRQR